MTGTSTRRPALLLALATALAGCGSATALGTTMLSGLFTGPEADATATVDAEIRANDVEQQLLHIVTDEGRRGVVRWDVRTEVAHGDRTVGAVSLKPGDRVQLRLRRSSEVDIYADYVLIRQRAPAAPADTARVELAGTVSHHDAEKGRFELTTAADSIVLVTLPYNPPADVVERFRHVRNGEQVRLVGRFIAERRFELERFN